MIPLKDTVHAQTFPVVNTMLIAANVIAFMIELSMGENAQRLVFRLGVIPTEIVEVGGYFEYATLITSMFLHAGWLHLFSNMLALYIFGDNVEDRMGPVRYLIFYLGCGIVAGIVHTLFNRSSPVPTIGASGAIAGVLGAYLVLYPRARVITLIPIFYLPYIIEIPALLYLGIWFLSQLLNGAVAIVSESFKQGGGVGGWAHAGGFFAGVVLVMLFARPAARFKPPPGPPSYSSRREQPWSAQSHPFADEYYPW
jgi:membrane associated rhomboid family serine protease